MKLRFRDGNFHKKETAPTSADALRTVDLEAAPAPTISADGIGGRVSATSTSSRRTA